LLCLESERFTWKNCQISAELEIEALCAALEPSFQVRLGESVRAKATFFDTFEWGVWFGERLLYLSGGQLRLCERDHDWIGDLRHAIPASARKVQRFVWEFPEGDMRDELDRLVGIRRLVRVARLSIRERSLDLLNDSQKTVFRFDLTDLFADSDVGEPFYRLCHLRPLRGYEAEASQALDILRTLGAREITEGPLAIFLRERGAPPRRYTLRPSFDLRPDLSVRETARRIIHRILTIARENEAGICEDIDTEFLHDYRICMRKIRSVLSLIEGIYPEEKTTRLRTLFAGYCEATNRLRDLDVYLLARERYTGLLPETLRPSLSGIFHDFSKERRRALGKVVRHLSSADYSATIEEVERFFSAPGTLPETEVSQAPAGPLIARRIYKRYKRIVKIELSLGNDTSDAVLHKVRIHCKKLRYLIEFFSELLPKGETEQIEKQLRRLQTCLGVFNDCSVQQRALLEYWNRKRREAGDHESLALTIGGLIALLNHGQQAERERFHDTLDDFCSPQIGRAAKAVWVESGKLAGDSTDEPNLG
jgi:CHAD domain-containing protein